LSSEIVQIMKKLFVFIVMSLAGYLLHAQNPVSWSFSSKKLSDKAFEVHLTANIQLGWHLYSQDQTLGIAAHQYSNKVDFVQVVKLRSNAKTNVSGSVEFQTCDDKKCLPPKTVTFNVSLK